MVNHVLQVLARPGAQDARGRWLRHLLLAGTAFTVPTIAHGQTQTWQGGSGVSTGAETGKFDWSNSANWASGIVPNGTADTASFGSTTSTDVVFSQNIILDGIQFQAGAPAYTFTLPADGTFITGGGITVTLDGQGIVNSSSSAPTFNIQSGSSVSNSMVFANSATSANAIFNLSGPSGLPQLVFQDTSNAANSTINAASGQVAFRNSASAGSATFNLSGSIVGGISTGGIAQFDGSSSLGNATFNLTGNGGLIVNSSATAGSAHINVTGSNAVSGQELASFNFTAGNAGTATIQITGGTNGNAAIGTFQGTSSAGNAHITLTKGADSQATESQLRFDGSSTAGNAVITNNGGLINFAQGGGTPTAGAATITTTGIAGVQPFTIVSGPPFAIATGPGSVVFRSGSDAGTSHNIIGSWGDEIFTGTSDAKTATFDIGDNAGAGLTGPGWLIFKTSATADSATINTHNNGTVLFYDTASGGNATFNTDAGGTVNFSNLTSGGVVGGATTTVGSINGAGSYLLGANSLIIGGTNLNSNVSGTISGSGGITKTGTGTLLLDGTNTYTGGTTISNGTVQIGDATHTGSIVGDVDISGLFSNLTFSNADTSGLGTVTAGPTGTINFLNTTDAGSATYDLTGAFASGAISAPSINFENSSSAGTATINLDESAAAEFSGSASAGNATINLNGSNTAAGGSEGGFVTFLDSSTGGNSHIVVTGGSNGNVAQVTFGDSSTAGNAVIDVDRNGNPSLDANTGAALTSVIFADDSDAGTATINNDSVVFFGTPFATGFDNATADHATINTTGVSGSTPFTIDFDSGSGQFLTSVSDTAGVTFFTGTSTAANATVNTSTGGLLRLTGSASGGNASINTNAGGFTVASGSFNANSATFTTTNGGVVLFANGANGQSATFDTQTGGILDFSMLTNGGTQAGNILGGGDIFLGANTLTVGGNGGNTTFSGVIHDGGSSFATANPAGETGGELAKTGSGTLTLTGDNSYTGGTAILLGTLQIGNGGTTGSILGNVADNATLAFDRSDSITFDGVVSGAGSLDQIGSGTTILTGASTYTGGTTISSGTLQIGNGGTTGSILGNVADNGTLAFDRSDNITFAGVVSGTGSLSKESSDALTLTGNNSYSGGTNLLSGTLIVGNNNALGTGTLAMSQGTTLGFTVSGLTVANAITLAGDPIFNVSTGLTDTITGDVTDATSPAPLGVLEKTGFGTLVLDGTNTYSGGTTISAGTLQIGDATHTGSITGDVDVSGGTATLTFSNADTSGLGTVTAGPTGTVNFLNNTSAGSATYNLTGQFTGTTITAPAINFENNSSAGTATINLDEFASAQFSGSSTAGNATITLNGSTTDTGGAAAGFVIFQDTADAGSSHITVNNGTNGNIAELLFGDSSDAGTSIIDNNGTIVFGQALDSAFDNASADRATINTTGVAGSTPFTIAFDSGSNLFLTSVSPTAGVTFFTGTSTAANATLNTSSGGLLRLTGSATGGNASINTDAGGFVVASGNFASQNATFTTTNGGVVLFANSASGGAATFDTQAGGILDFSMLTNGGTTAGAISGGGDIFLGANTLTVGGSNASSTFSGVIQDGASSFATLNPAGETGGSLVKTGTGTLTLTGDNTYTGGTTISGGTLQIGDGGTTGSIVGDVTDNGTLAFDRSDTVTFGGVVSGTGSLDQIGSGTLVLTGDNTYTGGTTISGGTLQVGNGGTSGSLSTGNVIDNGALAFDRSDTITFGGLISGTGSVSQIGSGTLVLTGDNTYSGGTTIDVGGTLQVGNGGTSGSLGTGAVIDNGTLAFDRSDSVSVGAISGTGSLDQIGSGTTILTGDNTYTGGTTISAGTLQIGDGGTTGSLLGDVTDNGTLAFDRSDTATFDGVVSGTGSLDQIGSGTTILTGDNSYTGGTTISGGTLQIGDGGTTGSITGDVIDNGTLAFDRSDDIIFGGVISGTGSVDQIGSGTLILTGDNTFTSSLNIDSGAVQIGNGGTTGSIGAVAVNDSTQIIFDRSDDISFGGVISGAGGLTKDGAGTLTISSAQTYTGATTIDEGTILLIGGGSIASTALNLGMAGATFDISGGAPLDTIGDLSGVAGTFVILGANDLTLGTANSTTFGGTFSGTGSLTKQGSGTLTLTADSSGSFSGDVNLADGTLDAEASGALGSGTLHVENSSSSLIVGNSVTLDNSIVLSTNLTVAQNSGSGTLAGPISEDVAGQGVTKTGAGTLILTGDNSYTGTTTISGGTLQVGNGGTTGTLGLGAVVDNANLAFDRSDTVAVGGAISGTGSLDQIGSGTLILTGANTYTGGTTISAGTLQIGNGGTTGSILGNVTDNATLAFDRSDSVTFGGVISGTGSLDQIGSGTIILTGDNSYTGGTTISAGTLQIGNGGTTGSILGNVTDNATLAFDRSDSVTFGGVISGTGSLDQIGSGTLILTGDNSYTGGTTISAGTLQVGNGGTTGSLGSGPLVDNATLAFDRSDSVTFGDDISGSGGLNQIGTGTLILTGNNSYAGTTTISAGTLQVGNGGTTGTLGVGPVIDNANLAFDRSDAVTVVGAISGTGSLDQIGSGTLILIGNNSYTGGTTISAGTLQVGNGGTTGSLGSGALVDDGTLAFDRSDSVTFGGVISGTGSLSQIGSGVLTLTAAETFTGQTNIANGTLALGAGGSIAAGSGVDLSGSAAIFDISGGGNQTIQDLTGVVGSEVQLGANTLTAGTANSTVFAGTIAGFGGLTKQGSGTLTLSGVSSYAGPTVVDAGTLAMGLGGSIASSSGVDLAAVGATFDISGGGDQTIQDLSGVTGSLLDLGANSLTEGTANNTIFAGTISGTGDLLKDGTGTLKLTADNSATFSGDIFFHGGLEAGATGAFGTGVVHVLGSTLIVDNGVTVGNDIVLQDNLTAEEDTGTGIISGVISETGGSFGVDKTGLGTLILTGDNSYTGGTTVSAGTLQIGNGGTSGSILGNVTDNSVLAFDRSDAITFGGVISGAGSLDQIGSGTLILTADNTYTGGTTITAGTLQIGNGGTTGSILGDVTDNGTLAFDRSDSVTFGGIISGTGALAQIGSGTLILTANNSYTGGTTISGGTLQIGNGGTTGSLGSGPLVDDGTLAFDRSDNIIFGGAISGTGSLAQIGSGSLILTGANTYSGGTTIDAGSTLQVGNGGTGGSLGTGNVTDDGVLAFDRSDAVIVSGAISGTGSLDQIGSGTTILAGNDSYTGGTTISAGILQIGNGGTTGSITGNVTDNSVLDFDRSDTITFGGIISGTGALAQIGTGTTILTNAGNSFSGGTFVDSGILRMGVNGALPSGGLLDVALGGTLDLNNFNLTVGDLFGAGAITLGSGTLTAGTSDSTLFSGVISGSGGLVKQGTGTLVLGGANSFTGGTTIDAGVLQLGTGGSLASTGALLIAANSAFDLNGHNQTIGDLSGAGFVLLGSGTLTEGTANNTTFAGDILGTGGLTKQGTGTLTLSGVNSFTGATTINAGTLAVSGGAALSDTTDVTVGGAGTLDLLDSERIGSLAGSGSVQLGANLLATGGNNGSTTFSGVISGTGTLLKEGTGTFTLSGANTFTGGAQVDAGTLAMGSGGSIASAAFLDLANTGATFDISAGGNQTIQDLFGVAGSQVVLGANTLTEGTANSSEFDGVISGTGGLTKVGTGALMLTGANTFTGATQIDAGALILAGGSALSDSSDVTIASGALLDLESDETIGGLSGAGDVQLNTNTLTFGADNASTTFSGQVGGSGGFTKVGTGLFTFSGTNFSTGLTSVLDGEFSLLGAIANDMVVTGAGTLSGTGMIAGNLLLQDGGTVAPGVGSGNFGNLLVGSLNVSGGTLLIDFGGASTGFASDQLIVGGDVTLTGGLVDANPVTGTSDFTFDQKYLIVAASNVSGTFTNPGAFTPNSHDPDLLERLRYDPAGIFLEIRKMVEFSTGLTRPNEIAVANALNSTERQADDGFASLLDELDSFSTADRATAFNQLSGEGAADAAWLGIEGLDRFTSILQEHLGTGPGGGLRGPLTGADASLTGSKAATLQMALELPALMLGSSSEMGGLSAGHDRRNGFWLEGFSVDDHLKGDPAGAFATKFSGEGAAAGFDLALGDNAAVGLAGGYAQPKSTTPDLDTRANGTSYYVGGYARYDAGRLFGGLTADYGSTNVNINRGITFGGSTMEATAKTRDHSFGLSGLLGYRIGLNSAGELQPLATVTYSSNHQDGFTEQGAALVSLQVDSVKVSHTVGTLGARWLMPIDMGSMTLTPELRGAFATNWGDRNAVLDSVFTGAPAGTGAFQVSGARLPRSWGVVGAGLSLGSKSDRFSLHAGYEGAFGSQLSAHRFDVGVTFRF